MLSSINKTAALAVIGILFASISQSVCLAEVPTQKSYLRSVSKGTRVLKDRGEPDPPQREIEIGDFDDREAIVAVGAEAPLKPPPPTKEPIDSEPQISPSVPINDQTKDDDVEVAEEAPLNPPTKEPIDSEPQISPSVPIDDQTKGDDVEVAEEAPLNPPTKEPIDSEPQISPSVPINDKDKGDDVEVGEGTDLRPTKPDKGVDSADFLIRGHQKKSCAWLEKKEDGATKKWCKSKAFKKNKKGDDKPRVYEYCGKTCCDAGLTEACA